MPGLAQLEDILSMPDYADLSYEQKHQFLGKVAKDKEVLALPEEDRFQIYHRILFPVEEPPPQLPGNISPSEVIPTMREHISGGFEKLQQASQMPEGLPRIKEDIGAGLQILGGIATPITALSQEVGRRLQSWAQNQGLEKTADVLGGLASAGTAVAGPIAASNIGTKIGRRILPPSGVSQPELTAARETFRSSQTATEGAQVGAAETRLASSQAGTEAETALGGVQAQLPTPIPRTQIGSQIKADIETKISDLVDKARSHYDPIMQEASQIPIKEIGKKIEGIEAGTSGEVIAGQMAREAATWRDITSEVMSKIQSLQQSNPEMNFATAAKMVLENMEKKSVADLILKKQAAALVMRKAENAGQDNAARLARIELEKVNKQIAEAAPSELVNKLKAADEFYKTEYAPVASYGSFPRNVRDMAPEDMANAIIGIGSRKGQIEAIESMQKVLSPETQQQLAGNFFGKLMEKSAPQGVFDPMRALVAFRQIDPEVKAKLFGAATTNIDAALNMIKNASTNRIQAEKIAGALQDATKIAEMKFEKLLSQGSWSQKAMEARAMRASGPGGMFMRIIGGEELGRGILNTASLNAGIGVTQILRGASLAFPIQLARMIASPSARAIGSTLARIPSPTTQAYTGAVSKLADFFVEDTIQQIRNSGTGGEVSQ